MPWKLRQRVMPTQRIDAQMIDAMRPMSGCVPLNSIQSAAHLLTQSRYELYADAFANQPRNETQTRTQNVFGPI